MRRKTSRRILVVGPSWVGDMVMAQSLFKVLRGEAGPSPGQQGFATADAVDAAGGMPPPRIDVLAPAWTRPLLERMPEVYQGIDMPLGHGQLQLGRRKRLGHSLRTNRYDQAIVLPNSLKSALIPWWTGIVQRTGYTGELRYGLLNDRRRLDKQRLTMTVQRFVALGMDAQQADAWQPQAGQIPPPALQVDPLGAQQAMEALGVVAHDDPVLAPVLALCPGAEYGPAKRWPADKFAQIARHYGNQGWQVWLFGSDKDREVCAAIAGQAPHCVDLAGRTSLGQAIDLMSLSRVVVSNDSGLMHVAAALERPLVAIYGSSDPRFTPPLNAQKRILSLGLECSPCFERECPLQHLDCLRNLEASQVVEAVDALTEKIAGKATGKATGKHKDEGR